jgi:geranylgeranyl diphosphate synthase type II
MDNDDLRRGRPTNHRVYGEAMAILGGDALNTMAFELLAKHVSDPKLAITLIKELARATGPEGMIGGQVLDLEGEHSRPSEASVLAIHRAKTGALIRASIVAGGIYAGASEPETAALAAFGSKAGLAFQIVDDVLDVTGSAASLGKTAGKDTASHKATWPAVKGVEASLADARRLIDEAFAELSLLGERSERLMAVARYLVERTR